MNLNKPGSIIFALAVGFLVYVFGVMTAQFNLWPNSFFTKVKNAANALVEIQSDRERKLLPSLELSNDVYQAPTVIEHVPNSGDGYVYVDGGANQLRSHCPDIGCIGWLMDRKGEIVHVWDVGADYIWRDTQFVEGIDPGKNAYSVGAHLYPNGDLLVTYQGRNLYPYGVGIAKFDKDSNLLWKRENFAHHWLSIDDDGLIYVSAFREIEIPHLLGETNLQFNCSRGGMLEDVILILDESGNEVEVISIFDAFTKSDYVGAIFEHKYPDRYLPLIDDECDPTHVNDVRVITTAQAADSTLLNAGDMLISLRSTNALAVIDGETHLIKWLSTGRTVQQHAPRYIGNDELLVFDNLGGTVSQGGSRIVRLNMLDDSSEVVFPRPDTPADINFLTNTAGHIELNADNTRALLSLTRQGRTLEVDLESGDVLWEYINAHDVTGLLEDRPADEPAYGRFATQTLIYLDEPRFELNGGRLN